MSTESVQDRLALVVSLGEITARFSHMHDLSSLGEEVMQIVGGIVEVEYSGLYLFDEILDRFHLVRATGFSEEERLEAERTAMDRHPGRVIRERAVIHIPDTQAEPTRSKSSTRAFAVRSRLWLPVLAREDCVGAIGLASSQADHFTALHIELLKYVANMTGLVYQNLVHTKALSLARDRAQAADQAKTEFLATVSHELRTPMNGVLGMTELLLDSPLDTEQAEQAGMVQRSALSLMEMIEDLLDYGRIESGNVTLDPRPFRPHTMVEDVLSMVRKQALAGGVSLNGVVDSDVPTALLGDVGRLRRVLTNLVANAVKFSPNGQVDVRVSVQDEGEQVRLVMQVEDTGIGMDEKVQAKLFERFSQGDSSITRRFGGTGLGLSISRSLSQLMGGELRLLRSEPGLGSCFEATVCMQRARELELAPKTGLAKPEVLIVDDNAVNRRVAELLCQRSGWGVSSAEDGLKALDLLAARSFDLVLMDVHMPLLDGITTTERLRRVPSGSPNFLVPVFALTADRLPETQRRCFAAGMDGFVAKPLTLQKVEGVLGRFHNHQPHAGHVLVADDDLVNRKVLTQLLERLGYSTQSVTQGTAALEALKTGTYSMAFLDLHMPGRTGLEVLSSLEVLPCPMVILTGEVRSEVREACILAGARAVLSKPLERSALLEVLNAEKKQEPSIAAV